MMNVDFKDFDVVLNGEKERLVGRYELDTVKAGKFKSVCEFLIAFADRIGGHVEYLTIDLEATNGGLTVGVPEFELTGEDLVAFTKLLDDIDVFAVNRVTPEMLFVDIVVANIWKAVPVDEQGET